MPFKSKAQRRKFAALLIEGKISPETYEEWNRETGRAKLPERLHPEKPKRRTRSKPKRRGKSSPKRRAKSKSTAGRRRSAGAKPRKRSTRKRS